jgi:hypothetical protein
MAHHVIYVPGLGDHHAHGQNIIINLWRLFGLKPHYFPLGWNNPTGFSTKLNLLNDYITELHGSGNVVSLVGVSAGASAVINAYSVNRHVSGVVYICGKINHPENVGLSTFAVNPDFKESLMLLQYNLEHLSVAGKQRLLNIYPYKDQTVPYKDTRIQGVKEIKLPGWSHAQGILSGVILGVPYIAKFLHTLAPPKNI